ncbi:MAG: hypothetical protein JXB00_11830 [Bacteroidales bacterium]|nr:hypothetical protein [Bacteroidales bacterium]
MKKILRLFLPVAGFVLLLNACSSDIKDSGFIVFNGESYPLNYGMVEDYGTNDEITYRNYWIGIQSSQGDMPSHYITFELNSNNTAKIGEGTYVYKWYASDPGEFSSVKVAFDLEYDEYGEKIAGTVFNYMHVVEGTLVISKNGDYNKFEFNLTFEKENSTYTVTGEFSDVLHEEYFYY